MTFWVTHRTGAMESDYPCSRFAELLDELLGDDDEHPDVSVTHESEWSLSLYRSGNVVLEHLVEGGPMHLGSLDRDEAVQLMTLLARGAVVELRARPWKVGYPGRAERP